MMGVRVYPIIPLKIVSVHKNRRDVGTMMYVSRYSNPELKSGDYVTVGISLGRPKWPLGYTVNGEIDDLKPWGLLRIEDKAEYERRYRAQLDRKGVDRIIRSLDQFGHDKPVVLLCYEDVRDPSQWCHRTMFAQWWLEQTGEIVEELPDPSTPKLKTPQQSEKPIGTRSLSSMTQAMKKAEERIRERQAARAQISMFDSGVW